MIILGIETSCDDTCASVIRIKNPKAKFEADFEILSNVISSQVKLHAKYGGVYPDLAKREHAKNLPLIFKKAISEAKKNNPGKEFKIDLVAVNSGPGLDPCLWIGIGFSKELAKKLKAKIIPTNHVEAHILANWFLPNKNEIKFPAICLIVSGGHTQLVLMKRIGKYKILGETRDDAAGECFDKTARILGLGYPGGPIISKLAQLKDGKSKIKIDLPRPMIYQKNYDFSFSGLKTAVLYDFKSRTNKVRGSKEYIKKMAKEIQQAVIDVLIYKTLKALKNFKAKSVLLAGGVAANQELRKQLESAIKKENDKIGFFVPPTILCTDNAAMAAIAGYFHWLKKKSWKKIEADANLRVDRNYERFKPY